MKDQNIIYSPWGVIYDKKIFAPGFIRVYTGSHGGFMLSEEFVKENNLSEAAKKRVGFISNGYYCYEEDCAWAIPAFELEKYWPEIFKNARSIGHLLSNDECKHHILEILSRWNADYLIERGIKPIQKMYEAYLEFEELKKRWENRK